MLMRSAAVFCFVVFTFPGRGEPNGRYPSVYPIYTIQPTKPMGPGRDFTYIVTGYVPLYTSPANR